MARAHVYKRDHINTDEIIPARYLNTDDMAELTTHCMEDLDTDFVKKCQQGDIIVGGDDFGCGSSREHAVWAIQGAKVGTVIAQSFARIFYRNCINLGLPLLVCPGVTKFVVEGNELKINLEKGIVENISGEEKCHGEQISDYAFHILEAGGIKPLLRAQQSTG